MITILITKIETLEEKKYIRLQYLEVENKYKVTMDNGSKSVFTSRKEAFKFYWFKSEELLKRFKRKIK